MVGLEPHTRNIGIMKTLAVLACGLICTALALQVPQSIIRVKRNSADDVVRVVEWMTDSGRGVPQWAQRLRSDAECQRCPLLWSKPFNGWPAECDECVKPFLPEVKAVPYCGVCYQKQQNCLQCQHQVKMVAHSGSDYRNQQATAYLRKIYVD